MTPEAALQKQIARYREMNCEQRLLIGLRLHELANEMARTGIRAQNPQANQVEVERELIRRRAIGLKPEFKAMVEAALSGQFKPKQT